MLSQSKWERFYSGDFEQRTLGILRQLNFILSSVTLSNCHLHRLSSPVSKMNHFILLLYPWLYLLKCDAK